MKLTPSKINDDRWKEWFNDSFTFYFGKLPKGDYRLGITIGNKEVSVDFFTVTFGYDRNK